jgi:hypothetical protein
METIRIEATKKHPFVLLDAVAGRIEISGPSVNVDIIQFYEPILAWIEEYAKSPIGHTVISCRLSIYNTITSKVLLHIFRIFEKLEPAYKAQINWHIDKNDIDMRETGDDYKSVLKNLEFNIIEDLE